MNVDVSVPVAAEAATTAEKTAAAVLFAKEFFIIIPSMTDRFSRTVTR